MTPRLRFTEVFGLSPLPVRAREALLALRGNKDIPASRFDVSSLGVLHPSLSVKTWLGWRRPDRLVPISNLFNRTPTPIQEGWSVRKTQVRDFRGQALTYDSHNGTDFAVPVGTVVVAAAPGKVLRISSEFNRGGLKVFLDHGQGLVTTSNHLARTLVHVGDVVDRGQPLALSGYSGLDGLAMFPWSVPHVHFNVWLNGDYVDPFAAPGEISLWRHGNLPLPSEKLDGEAFTPTPWNLHAVQEALDACADPAVREALQRDQPDDERALNTLFQLNYFPTCFALRPQLVRDTFPRTPRLTLPFRGQDFAGIALD
jgi:murein DD-endopeptidase